MWLLAAASAAGRGAVVLVGTTAERLLAAAQLPPALSACSTTAEVLSRLPEVFFRLRTGSQTSQVSDSGVITASGVRLSLCQNKP